jgi:hypothetical protein
MRSGNALLRAYVAIFVVLGGGWALFADQTAWVGWLSAKAEAVMTAIAPETRSARGVVMLATDYDGQSTEDQLAPQPAAIETPPAPLQPIESHDVADPPPIAAEASATEGDADAAESEGDAALLTASKVADESDPFRKRASAVGLHPDLSRVLLGRLSPTDYRNAGFAIRTALAKTPDDGVFVWPRQRKPELALFRVRFVPGAATDCRRYVVTIVKDRWSTTALPMEKCGPEVAREHG